ncbi:hypothetical protein [Elioraea sp.]
MDVVSLAEAEWSLVTLMGQAEVNPAQFEPSHGSTLMARHGSLSHG